MNLNPFLIELPNILDTKRYTVETFRSNHGMVFHIKEGNIRHDLIYYPNHNSWAYNKLDLDDGNFPIVVWNGILERVSFKNNFVVFNMVDFYSNDKKHDLIFEVIQE